MNQRRSDQLASLIEVEQQNPLTITTGKVDNDLDKWLSRQVLEEGERLKNLMIKLWSGITWKKNHRVLVLESNSLLWSLKPLREASEGGVVLAVAEDNHPRLLAELEILAPMERPVLIDSTYESIEKLEHNLKFEVIGGRIPWKVFSEINFLELWPILTEKCTANTYLSLIISNPCSGPAFSLKERLEFYSNKKNTDFSFLSDLICKEEKWLNKQEHKKKFILQLEKLGWNISFEEWTEFVYQKVDNTIIKRWLNQGSEYREIILKNCEEETLIRLQELFKRLDGQTIKQKLIHTKFLAKNSN